MTAGRTGRVVVAAALLAAACGRGTGEGRPDPASLTTCREVAAAAVAVIQESIDIVDLAADGRTEPDPVAVADVEAAGAVLEERALELGCTEEEMAALVAGLADTLEARSVYGQLVIEGLRAGGGGIPGEEG